MCVPRRDVENAPARDLTELNYISCFLHFSSGRTRRGRFYAHYSEIAVPAAPCSAQTLGDQLAARARSSYGSTVGTSVARYPLRTAVVDFR